MPAYDRKTFGARLKALLQEQDVSLEELAERVGRKYGITKRMSKANLSTWQNGNGPFDEPARNVIDAIGGVLGVRAEYLLYGSARTEQDRRSIARENPDTAVEEAFERALPWWGVLDTPGRLQLWRVWGSLSAIESYRAELQGEAPGSREALEVACAERVAAAISAPLKMLDLHHGFYGHQLDTYVVNACEGLKALLRQQLQEADRSFRRSRRANNGEA